MASQQRLDLETPGGVGGGGAVVQPGGRQHGDAQPGVGLEDVLDALQGVKDLLRVTDLGVQQQVRVQVDAGLSTRLVGAGYSYFGRGGGAHVVLKSRFRDRFETK